MRVNCQVFLYVRFTAVLFFHIVSEVYSVRNLFKKSQLKTIVFQSDRSQRFKGSDCEFCIPLRVVNWTCHLGLLEIRGEIQYVVNNWKYDVKLSKNSILKKEYCKGITIFLCIIIYLLYWWLISTFLTFQMQYTFLKCSTRTQVHKDTESVFSDPKCTWIRDVIIWTPAYMSFPY